VARRGPVTLRLRDLERLRAALRVIGACGAFHDQRAQGIRSHTDILPVMQASYLLVLIVTVVGIAALSLYVLLKLLAGQR